MPLGDTISPYSDLPSNWLEIVDETTSFAPNDRMKKVYIFSDLSYYLDWESDCYMEFLWTQATINEYARHIGIE